MVDRDAPDRCYCLASRKVARHLARLYDRHLSPAGLTSAQYSILSMLRRSPGITMAQLGDAMATERTTLVRAIQALERSGWVVADPPPQGHAHTLALTQAGQEKFAEAYPMWVAAKDQVEAEFGKDRAQALRDILLSLPTR
jgi:DNA-binding MarR family transcriptional regulator